MEQSLPNGNILGLVSPFTIKAVKNGTGTTVIRREYAGLFATTEQRRMSISGLTWHTTAAQRRLGHGTISIRDQSKASVRWRDATGRTALELAPWMGEYKISKTTHRVFEE